MLTVVGLLYTIPSLVAVRSAAACSAPATCELNVVIALTVYAVAIMTRSVADAWHRSTGGVLALPRIGTARGGASGVELPLAGPVLLAGLRVVAVSTVAW